MKPLKWPETDGDGHGQAGAVVEKRATSAQEWSISVLHEKANSGGGL